MKKLLNWTASVLVLPAVVLYGLGRLTLGAERAFPGWSQLFAIIPGLTGQFLRRAFYRFTLARCGTDACISFGAILSHPAAEVGDRAYVGSYCVLGNVTVGDDVLLDSHVSVMNGPRQHGVSNLDVPIREQPGELVRVAIGQGAWVGERAVIMADVGRQCVVGAGAVVTRPIPDFALAVGVPARVVRDRQANGVPGPSAQEAPEPRRARDTQPR